MPSTEQLYQLFLRYPRITTDSRNVIPESIFFAIKGERFDGNRFAEQAIEKGACFAVIDNPEFDLGEQYVLVNNVLKAMQDLARFHREQFEIPLIGITGSNGKTTTKELVYHVLNSHYRTHFTKGNFNNHIGLPLTLLQMPADTEVAIIEMGANHRGEIKLLCEIARPTHGLVTNIGKAHLEGFGGLEGVKKGKGELYDFLSQHNGLAFVNLDESYLEEMSRHVPHRVFYQESQSPDPSYQPLETNLINEFPFLKVAFSDGGRSIEVQSQLVGRYNFHNIQTAVSLGRYFKVPAQKIKTAIEKYRPKSNRSQFIEKNSNTILLDAYNANPSSMKQALLNFSKMEAVSKMAILGDMLELGGHSLEEHKAIVDYASQFELDALILVGKEFMNAVGQNQPTHCFENTEALATWFREQRFAHQLILIKGSRGLALEKLLE